MTLPTADF